MVNIKNKIKQKNYGALQTNQNLKGLFPQSKNWYVPHFFTT